MNYLQERTPFSFRNFLHSTMLEPWILGFITAVLCNFILVKSSSDFLQFNIDIPENLSSTDSHNKVVVCYIGTWSHYRPDAGKFELDDLRPKLCTHLVYSFAGLDNITYTIKSTDPYLDLTENYGKGWYKKMTDLRSVYPKLKVLLAIGGWNEGSEGFSTMAASKDYRTSFIASVMKFLQDYNFDGLDLDWEYPTDRGGRPEDKENFVKLVKELKSAFTPKNYQLTAALSASPTTSSNAYNLKALAPLMDHVHLMAYDFHGIWDSVVGHNAPLDERQDEEPYDKTLNSKSAVNMYLKAGVPPNKLVLGVPFYGRVFLLKEKNNTRLGAPSLKESFKGPYTRENGFLGYNEICEMISNEEGWTRVWSDEQKVPYAYKDDKWVGYDDTESLTKKVEFAASLGLKGIMIWSIDTDDFRPKCSAKQFPLLRTINYALHLANKTSPIKPTPEPSLAHRCISGPFYLLFPIAIVLWISIS